MARQKYKKYTHEQLCEAVDQIKRGILTNTRASKRFDIPRKTLDDYLKGKRTIGKKSGQKPYLTQSQDSSLANYVKYTCERGFGLTRKVLHIVAFSIVQRTGSSSKSSPSKKWCQRFMKRHNLSFRTATSLARSRVAVSSQQVIDNYCMAL
ncbi:unnamed protein product [Mytilus coruscus]|uniref:HTH CENPB-type domain-containing protein n=1 Tax=Mytilus coruscus TaxID=42192 RepID=A0A6J8CI32_MYTCO|nr:unnamed protein product [Mytilus coruscus]